MATSFTPLISEKRWLTFFCITLFTLSVRGQTTLYTYQSGSWDNIDVWTTDPGGTTLTGSKIPGNSDAVVILPSRTITLPGNIATTGLSITINAGGSLDAGPFVFSGSLNSLNGQGILRLSSSDFPDAATNNFVNTGGGTVEYYNAASFNLSSVQDTYNNLLINCPGFVASQVTDLTVNGNLSVQGGTFRINDATERKLTLVVKGNVDVNAGAFISVGTGRTNPTTTDPTATGTGGTAPFLDYYTAQSHHIEIYGNLTNDGSVRFTNQNFPVYNLFPVNGFATVFFMGESDATITCNGTTDFYNIVINKGTDQTYILTVNSSAYNSFRLFGANNAGSFGPDPANPDVRKALWIRNGTLKLNGYVFLPSLTEGGGDFIIPGNGALEVNSPDAVVMSTIDNYYVTELAYGVNGGGAPNGVATGSVIQTDLALYGKLQVNDGKLYVGEYSRIVYYGSSSSAQFIINGGIIDTKQFQSLDGGGRTAYWQTDGTLVLRGRFQRTLLNTNLSNLISSIGNVAQLNITRANGPEPGLSGTLNIDQPENIFHMEGGAIEIFDVTGTAAGVPDAIEINSDPANVSVTGGTITLDMRTGSGTDTDYGIYSTAPVFSAFIKRTSGTSVTVLRSSFTALGDLTLSNTSATPGVVFNASSQNLTIGEDFLIQANAGYTPGTNRTKFNGGGEQNFTNLGTITSGLYRFIVEKNSGTLSLGSTISVRDSLVINSGTLSDGGYILNVAGNVYNAGTHTGTGKLVFNGSVRQYIYALDGSLFGNLELKSTYNTAPYWALTFQSDISAASFRLAGTRGVAYIMDYGLTIRNMALHLGDRATNYSATKMFMTDGSHSAKGINLYLSLSGNLNTNVDTVPLGVYHQATPAAWFSHTIINVDGNLGTTTYTGNVNVIPVDAPHPSNSNPANVINFYWKTFCTGTLTSIDPDYITFSYDNSNVTVPSGGGVKHYHFEQGTSDWIMGGNYTNPLVFNLGFISGAFTAGKNNPFMAPKICKAVRTGFWDVASTWDNGVPASYDYAVIGSTAYGNVTVTIRNNNTVCAGVSIFANGVAGDATKPTLVVNANRTGINLTTVSGGGRFVLYGSNTITLPGGDFDMFCKNDTAIFVYNDNGTATGYVVPSGIQIYPNLHITSGINNFVKTLPDINITVLKSLRLYSSFTGNTLAMSGPNARNITVNGNMDFRDGSVIEIPGTGTKTINLYGNLDFRYGNTNNTNWIRAYLLAGGPLTHVFNFYGDTINSGASSLLFNQPASVSKMDLYCKGPGNVIVAEGSGNFNLNRLFIQKDVVTDTIKFNNNFLLNASGNSTAAKSLVLTTGTLVISDPGNSASSTVNLNLTSGGTNYFNLNSTSRLILRNGAKVNITGSTVGSGIRLDGSLQAEGASEINLADGTGNNGYVEYTGSGNSEIILSGSAKLKVDQVRRSLSLTTGVLKYSQSGSSEITVYGAGANVTRAKFEVTGTGSSFDMNGSTKLYILRGSGITFGDLYLRPELSAITGGEIIFGTGMSGQSFRMDATISLQDITIDAVAGASNLVQLMVNPLVLKGNLSLTPGNSGFNANNLNVTIGGNFLLNGVYNAGTNTTFFNGIDQTINGTTDPQFYNLTISPSNKLTLLRHVTVNSGLSLNSGILEAGIYNLTVKGNVINNGTYTNDAAASSRLLINGTTTQNISGTGSYGRIEIDNASGGARLGNNLSLTEDLKLTNGIFDINQYSLVLGAESDIIPAVFGTGRMIKSDGVFSNGGITKHFNAGYTGTFVFPSGVTGKYTPANLNIIATGAGWVKINVINEKHPASLEPYNVLNYYWEAESSISAFEGNLTLEYSPSDVAGDEAQYVAARLVIPPGTGWSKASPGPLTDNVNETAHTISFGFPSGTASLGGHYTAGYSSDLPNLVPVYTSNNVNGNWNVSDDWLPVAPPGGPNGAIVIIRAGDFISTNGNRRFAFRTTIDGTLNVGTTYGHNLGGVDGTGTLSMSQANLPAGDFESFVSCNGGTLEYDGGSYTIIADRIDTVKNIIFKGTGTKGLPDKDLVICNLLEINGPVLNNQFNRKLSVAGSFILASGSFLSGAGANATVTFMGTNPQTVSGFLSSSPLNNLEINNSSGLTLNSELVMKGNLLLTNGTINSTATNLLRMTSTSATVSGGSTSSFVNGPMSKNQLGGIDFTFPVGNGTRSGNVAIVNPQSGVWEAEYFNSGYSDLTYVAPLMGLSQNEHWRIKSPSDGKTATIRLRWDNLSDINPATTGGGINDIRIAEYDGADWREKASAVPSGNNSAGTVETASNIPISNSGHPRFYTLGSTSQVKPTILTGISPPVCRCSATASLPYISTTGNPTQYTIDYTDPAFTDVSTWTALPLSPIPLVIPPSAAPGVYTGTIRVRTLPANTSIPYSFSIMIMADMNWTGAAGTSWTNIGNWSCSYLPDASIPVIIPDVTNEPIIGAGQTVASSNLTIDAGSSLTINGTLSLSGSITNNGTITATDGTIELAGSVAQAIPANAFTSNRIKNLTLNNASGASLLGPLEVRGLVMVQSGTLSSAGNLTLVSDAIGTALVDGSGLGNITGNVTMQRYLSSSFGYKYFSSPFQAATVGQLSDEVDLTYWFPLIWAFDENRNYLGTPLDPFYSYVNSANVLNPMEGYAVNFGADPAALTVDITGIVNNGYLSRTLYNHNHLYAVGKNMVGNPYPSPIDWTSAQGWTKTNIDNALYYFKSGGADEWEGEYSSWINGVSSDGIVSNIIPSMQGFLVHVSDGAYPVTGTLAMDNRVRVNGPAQEFSKKSFRKSSEIFSEKPLIRLNAGFTEHVPASDPLVIYFDYKATDNFDKHCDALKFNNTDHTLPNFWSYGSDLSKLSINGLPFSLDTIRTVPLGYASDYDGEVKFSLKDIEGPCSWDAINLFDAETGETTDLLSGGVYTITLPAGEYPDRFYLNFNGLNTSAGSQVHEMTDIFKAYSSHGLIYTEVFEMSGSRGVITIYSLTGNVISKEAIYSTGRYEFDPGLRDGICIVSFVSGNLRISEKVIIKN